MRLKKYTQTTTERKRYTVDYTEWLDTGETITSVTFGITPVTSPALVVSSYAISVDGLSLAMFVAGGANDVIYELKITVTTSGNQVKQDEITFHVRDI